MRHLFTKRQVPCDLHDVVEGGWGGRPVVYPYRCSHCGRCFVCQHWTLGHSCWLCLWPPRCVRGFDPGVLVKGPRATFEERFRVDAR